MMIFSGKWIFIIFNPDSYIVTKKKYNPKLENKFVKLKEEIDRQVKRIERYENNDMLEIVKLYYNE